MGGGPEEIEDDEELRAVRSQAREIRSRATTIAVGVTFLLLILP